MKLLNWIRDNSELAIGIWVVVMITFIIVGIALSPIIKAIAAKL